MKKILLITVFLFSCLHVYSSDTMKITIDNVSIESPIGWLAQYSKSPQLFFLYSPVEMNDTFQENCNLTLEYLPSAFTVDEYKDASISSLKTVYSDFQLLKNEANFHIIMGYVGDTHVKQIQYFYIKSNIAYVLTFSSNPENFNRYLEQFESIAKTFIY